MFRSLLTHAPLNTFRPFRSADFSVLIQDSEPAWLPRLYATHHLIAVPFSREVGVERGSGSEGWSGRLGPGDVALHTAGAGHEVSWPEGVRCLYIHIHPHRLAVAARLAEPTGIASLPRHRDRLLQQAGRAMLDCAMRSANRSCADAGEIVDVITARLVDRYLAPSDAPPTVGTLPLDKLIERMHASDGECITTLARECGLTRAHFTRRFRSLVGLSPHRMRLAARIERAKSLLTTSRPLVEAGFACGFTDQAHFTKTFVRFTGITPSAYRESERRLTNAVE